MLNPSTADSDNDDPTIRRCMGFAKDWGFGGVLVGNLYAFRSTDKKNLRLVKDPVGHGNLEYITFLRSLSTKVICAWGSYTGPGSKVYHQLKVEADNNSLELFCHSITTTASQSTLYTCPQIRSTAIGIHLITMI